MPLKALWLVSDTFCSANCEITCCDVSSEIFSLICFFWYSDISITIPDSVTSIGESAFEWCSSLTDVYYGGSEEQWKTIEIGNGNDELENATIHYNSVAQTPKPTPTPTSKPTSTPISTPTPIPIVPTITAEIERNTSVETDTAYAFDIMPTAETIPESCFVYAAVYDESHALIAINRVPLETDGVTIVTVGKANNASAAKVFIWAKTMQAVLEQAKEFDLKSAAAAKK